MSNPMYSADVYVPGSETDGESPYANCGQPPPLTHCQARNTPSVWSDDALDAAIFWVAMREYGRAHGNMAAIDAAFRDAWENCYDGLQFVEKYGAMLNSSGAMPFADEMEDYFMPNMLGLVGGDPSACTVDWRQLACFCYWLAMMTPEQRKGTVQAIMMGTAVTPVCEPVMSDPVYFAGPTTKIPVPPKAKQGLTTGEKIGIGVAVGLVFVLAGVAGTSIASNS
jgi:hypothetical protein